MPTEVGGYYVEDEGTPGSAETLVAADAVDFHNLDLTPMTANVERPVKRETRWRPARKTPWRTHWQVGGELEVKHLDTADDTVAPELHDIIRSCGWTYDGTGSASGTHVYNLSDDPGSIGKGFTVRKDKRTAAQGLSATAHGCAGNLVFEWPEEDELVARLTALGDYNAPITQPTPLTGVYNGGAPAKGITSSSLHSSYTGAVIRSLTFDPAVEARLRVSGNTHAWPPYLAAPTDPSGELVVEEVPASTIDWYGLWIAGTTANWSFVSLLGTTQITLALSTVQVSEPQMDDQEPSLLRIPFTVHDAASLTFETP